MGLSSIPYAVVGSVIVVILVTMVLIPSISEMEEEQRGWQYDDYVPVSEWDREITGVSGALSLRTYAGVDYVRASGIGEGVITFSDGSTETVDVGRARLDVYMVAGQSNSTMSMGNAAEAEPYPRLGTAYFYHSDELFNAFQQSGRMIRGTGPPLAATYYELTGHKILLICAGIGGQTITNFLPPDGSMWAHMQQYVEAAMSGFDPAYYDISVESYFWLQGEQDKYMSVDTYKEHFLTVNDAILSGDLGLDFKHCLISLVRPQNGPTAAEAQMQVAEEYPDRYIMATTAAETFTVDNGLMSSDDLHYSQAGYNIIGDAWGRVAAEMVDTGTTMIAAVEFLRAVPLILMCLLIVGIVIVLIIRDFR